MLGSFILIMTIVISGGEDIVREVGQYDNYTDCFYQSLEKDRNDITLHCEYHEDKPYET